MSIRLTRAYFCDRCGAIGKSKGHFIKPMLPDGWSIFGKSHLCPVCTNSFETYYANWIVIQSIFSKQGISLTNETANS